MNRRLSMFDTIEKGATYSRPELAKIWGYKSYHAFARGVVTPAGAGKIILFVTEDKQLEQEQYIDRLVGDQLHWEGPTDHFGEQRIVDAEKAGEEIHLFYRKRHHSDFTYVGQLGLAAYTARVGAPSAFVFTVR